MIPECPTCEEPMVSHGASDVVNTFRYYCPSCGTTTEITYATTVSDDLRELRDLMEQIENG